MHHLRGAMQYRQAPSAILTKICFVNGLLSPGSSGLLKFREPENEARPTSFVWEPAAWVKSSHQASIAETFKLFVTKDMVNLIVVHCNTEGARITALWNEKNPAKTRTGDFGGRKVTFLKL